MDYYTRKEKAVKLIEKLVNLRVSDETIYYNVEKSYLFGKLFCQKQIERIKQEKTRQRELDDGQTSLGKDENRRI